MVYGMDAFFVLRSFYLSKTCQWLGYITWQSIAT